VLFNSLEFVLFAIVFFGMWPLARRRSTSRYLYICFFSFFFYGWWNWHFLILLAVTGLVDYLAGLAMESWPLQRKAILAVSIASNLLTLGFFKYGSFFAANLNHALLRMGEDWKIPMLALTLPVGISFYTFQSMSYTIDIYRGELRPTRNVLHFFAALSLFPHLVAGPIMRAAYLLPQLQSDRHPDEKQIWRGLQLIAQGYVKKMVIADHLAPAVNSAFAGPVSAHTCLEWWIIITMFAFQIYCDFSGYTDIARGLAKWMGYDFPLNFNHPYVSGSMREFWSRWHISLSTWFRDYLYVPLGGSHKGAARAHLNMWITMLLSGLWHGANWTYLVWGSLHAAYLSAERITRWPDRLRGIPLGKAAACALVVVQAWFGWVFFRATSIQQGWSVIKAMLSFDSAYVGLSRTAILFLCLAVIGEIYAGLHLDWRALFGPRLAFYLEPMKIAACVIAAVYLRGPGSAFIYFQF
jgi:alginate O-acetyltransferase complex protein AlgI